MAMVPSRDDGCDRDARGRPAAGVSGSSVPKVSFLDGSGESSWPHGRTTPWRKTVTLGQNTPAAATLAAVFAGCLLGLPTNDLAGLLELVVIGITIGPTYRRQAHDISPIYLKRRRPDSNRGWRICRPHDRVPLSGTHRQETAPVGKKPTPCPSHVLPLIPLARHEFGHNSDTVGRITSSRPAVLGDRPRTGVASTSGPLRTGDIESSAPSDKRCGTRAPRGTVSGLCLRSEPSGFPLDGRMTPKPTCSGTRLDGSPCRSTILTDGLCEAHGPGGREKMKLRASYGWNEGASRQRGWTLRIWVTWRPSWMRRGGCG